MDFDGFIEISVCLGKGFLQSIIPAPVISRSTSVAEIALMIILYRVFYRRPLLCSQWFALFQTFFNRIGQVTGDQLDGLGRVVVGGDGIIHQVGIRVGIHNSNGLNAQFFSLGRAMCS